MGLLIQLIGCMDLQSRGSVDAQTNRKDKKNIKQLGFFTGLAIHIVN